MEPIGDLGWSFYIGAAPRDFPGGEHWAPRIYSENLVIPPRTFAELDGLEVHLSGDWLSLQAGTGFRIYVVDHLSTHDVSLTVQKVSSGQYWLDLRGTAEIGWNRKWGTAVPFKVLSPLRFRPHDES